MQELNWGSWHGFYLQGAYSLVGDTEMQRGIKHNVANPVKWIPWERTWTKLWGWRMSSLRKGHLGWDLKHKEQFGNKGWLFIIINNKQSIIYITLLASISSRRNNARKTLRMKSRCHLKNRKRWMGKNPLRRVERVEAGKGVRFCKGLWMVWRCFGQWETTE